MTSLTPPRGVRADGPRRRSAVDYQQLGYDVEELPAAPAAVNIPTAASTDVGAADVLVSRPVNPGLWADRAADARELGLVTRAGGSAVAPDSDSEEEDWWAQGEDIPAPPVSSGQAEPLPSSIDQRPRGLGARTPATAMLSRILGLDRLGSPRRAVRAPAPVQHSDDGQADPAWLLDQPGTDGDTNNVESRVRAAPDAVAGPVKANGPGNAAVAVRARVFSRVAPADVEVSRAPRELGAAVRRALVGLVLVLIAFAGIKQVIWNPIFGRSAPAAAGPAVMDEVSADGAATRYALDYLSFSPRIAAAAAAAVSADVVTGGDDAPAQWAGTGYVRADMAVPTGWHIVDLTRAVVAVTVRVHLAAPPAAAAAGSTTAQTGSTTPQGLAHLAPATVPTPATPATRKSQTVKSSSAKPVSAPTTHPAAETTTATHPAPSTPVVLPPPAVTTAPTSTGTAVLSTLPPPSGSASDPGAIPAGWTDLGSRWLSLAVPVETSGGEVKVSTTGAILTGEPAGQIAEQSDAMPDSATATATSAVATSFFTAYAESNVAYLAQPGVNLTGLSGTVALASLANWTVTVPTTTGSASTTPTSGVGTASVTWQLAGTDLQIQQNYAIALTSSESRWYIAALSPAPINQP